MNVQRLVEQVNQFTDACRISADDFAFASTPGRPETLYGSAFACMIYHYTGALNHFTAAEKANWAAYFNRWQDPESGYFQGPELIPEEMRSRKHSFEHVSQHLVAHVLPALSLLGASPAYPLTFAYPFVDRDYLMNWLEARDWRDAWLEGNNLIFVGQFLIHLRDQEGVAAAQAALDLYFDWLDKNVDPATGLWGSNGYCSSATALYGGYHQLIVYYYEKRPLLYQKRLIDVALSLQHTDGGFHPDGGGGACEDIDAIDILVNMYKQVDYQRSRIRHALRRGATHIFQRQMPDGGFVYRLGQPFMHMGVAKTASSAGQSNLFPTWFRVHTLALMSEILTDELFAQWPWQFNDSCSMGWHRPWDKAAHQLTAVDRLAEKADFQARRGKQWLRRLPRRARSVAGRVKRRLLNEGHHG